MNSSGFINKEEVKLLMLVDGAGTENLLVQGYCDDMVLQSMYFGLPTFWCSINHLVKEASRFHQVVYSNFFITPKLTPDTFPKMKNND